MDCSPLCSSVNGIFLSKDTRVGCCFLLQGIVLTQGSSQPRDQTCVSCIAGRFFMAELPHRAILDTRAKEICTQLLMLLLTCIKGISNFCLLIVFLPSGSYYPPMMYCPVGKVSKVLCHPQTEGEKAAH